jgi:hypothetical protein
MTKRQVSCFSTRTTCPTRTYIESIDNIARVLIEISDQAIEANTKNVWALPQATELLVVDGLFQLEGRDDVLSRNIPDAASAISRRSQETRVIGAEAKRIDTTIVANELTLGRCILSIEQEHLHAQYDNID